MLLQSYPVSGAFSVIENEHLIAEKREYLYRSIGDDNWCFPFILGKNHIYDNTKSELSKKERKIPYVQNEENRRKIPYEE